MNAQRHTNTLRSHPLDRLLLSRLYPRMCSPEECNCYRALYRRWYYYYRCYYYRCCCYCYCYHHHDSNSWLASSDIDRYFQLLLCPFSRLLLRTCSHVHETICTVFNVIFQSRLYCYLVFLSVCSFLPMGLLSRERKNEIFEAQANRTLI